VHYLAAAAWQSQDNLQEAQNELGLGQNEQALGEFSLSVALDSHLPYSYLNLGWAQIALKNFSSAQESIQKASGRAPLDLNLLTALTYAQLDHACGRVPG
jgi:tetratricopeptide (TPR) repeat protein